MKSAIVVGSRGQDGTILTSSLMKSGYLVIGIARQGVFLDHVLARETADLRDFLWIGDLLREYQPEAVYYLAAFHHSSENRFRLSNLEGLDESLAVQVVGLASFLEAIATASPATRLLYASSSHIFGSPSECPQSERTKMAPESIYGITKQAGMSLCRSYRSNQRVHASIAILYTHESEYRAETFVSQRIIRGALEILDGSRQQLILGDLSAAVDWGYAPDTVEAMRRIVSLDEGNDFIVATGERHSVNDFVECVFRLAGLDWRKFIVEDPSLVARQRTALIGNATKLREKTGWAPTVTFEQMVERLWNAARKRNEA